MPTAHGLPTADEQHARHLAEMWGLVPHQVAARQAHAERMAAQQAHVARVDGVIEMLLLEYATQTLEMTRPTVEQDDRPHDVLSLRDWPTGATETWFSVQDTSGNWIRDIVVVGEADKITIIDKHHIGIKPNPEASLWLLARAIGQLTDWTTIYQWPDAFGGWREADVYKPVIPEATSPNQPTPRWLTWLLRWRLVKIIRH